MYMFYEQSREGIVNPKSLWDRERHAILLSHKKEGNLATRDTMDGA